MSRGIAPSTIRLTVCVSSLAAISVTDRGLRETSGVELVEDETRPGRHVAVLDDASISQKGNPFVSPVLADETKDASVGGQNCDGAHANTDQSHR